MVGDFGNSGIVGDAAETLPQSVYQPSDNDDQDDGGLLLEWEDIFSVGEILRTMVMTHNDTWDVQLRPNNVRVQDANQEPTAPPYSDELIELLQLCKHHFPPLMEPRLSCFGMFQNATL